MKLRPIDSIVSSAENVSKEEINSMIAGLRVFAEGGKRVRSFTRKDFQIGVRVTEEEYEFLKEQAKLLGVSMSAVVRLMMIKCIKEIQQ